MLKTSRKIFFSVVLISLLGSSSRCDAMFACLVVIAMKVAPYLIWTAPPVIIGGYQWYHNSLSVKMDRGFQEARQDREQLRTEIKDGFDTACQERTRLQTSVDGNGRAISKLAKQENLHYQTVVLERDRLHAVSQRSIQANGHAIELVQTSINDLSTTEAQHYTEHLQRFNHSDALVRENRNATEANGALIQANGNRLTTLQQTTKRLTIIQSATHTRLEKQFSRASQERANMAATQTVNSGQLFGLTETQEEFKLLLQQQSQTQTQQLTRMEAKIDRLLNQPSQLAHHSFLQRRQLLLWPSPRYALLPSATTAASMAQLHTPYSFLQRRQSLGPRLMNNHK